MGNGDCPVGRENTARIKILEECFQRQERKLDRIQACTFSIVGMLLITVTTELVRFAMK